MLAAEDEGLGSCIVGWFDETKVRKLLDIPSGKRILLDIVIGYSTQPDRPKKRKDPKEVISYNRYWDLWFMIYDLWFFVAWINHKS